MAFEPAGWVEFVDESTLNGHDGCSEFALPAEYSDGSIGVTFTALEAAGPTAS